jgi:SAM-dependent methyltransferase
VQNHDQEKFDKWLAAAERRYLADLRVQEITRALRALSSAYVERRERGGGQRVRGALDTAGKRAAFALYYAPLHFIAVADAVRSLRVTDSPPNALIDLGCGTGAAGAAWAIAAESSPSIIGLDRHPWAVAETRWTYSQFGLKGYAKQGDLERLPSSRAREGIVAAYTLNELPDGARGRVEQQLFDRARGGGRVLIVEPLARAVAPWWDDMATRVVALGGRADEWQLTIDVPPIVGQLGAAAGLNYRELRFQTMFL